MFQYTAKILLVMAIVLAIPFVATAQNKPTNPKVLIKTSLGEIELELNAKKAPVSVENYLSYVKRGFYTNTIFHRVIKGFMIQGGGFDKDMSEKDNNAPIINEAVNGLKNYRGTIAYARTQEVNSATSQFFINLVDNSFLDNKDTTPRGFGYAVFGKVVRGMDVVNKIGSVQTESQRGMNDVPVEPVIILSATLLNAEKPKTE